MKSLVIYFSHTGENYTSEGLKNLTKGNTEVVAEKIAELTNAKLFKVEPTKEYPYDYKECCDVAKKEIDEEKRPDIKNMISDIDSYDVIYIGGPIWWGHYPCPIFTALEKLNFSGKIVMPFSTHEGSGLGYVMEDVKKMCDGADIKEGLAIYGSRAASSNEALKNWCLK